MTGLSDRCTFETQSTCGNSEILKSSALKAAASKAKLTSLGVSEKYAPTSQRPEPSSNSKTPIPIGSGESLSNASPRLVAFCLPRRVVRAVKVVIKEANLVKKSCRNTFNI